ncbi:hypothetical protein N7536_000340 [Penicillium majusculum]|nr:hypothetical protein N7536_000340 [Penicillium majusculum]
MAPLTKSQRKNRKNKKRRSRRAAEDAAKAPPPSAKEVDRLWAIAHSALNRAATATGRRVTADAAAPGSGDATAAGGDLSGPDRGGGQGALQGVTEQTVTEPLPGGPTDPAPASPVPSSPPYSPSYSPPTFGPCFAPCTG